MDSKYLSCKCNVDNEDIDLQEPEKFLGNLTYSLSDYELKYTSYKTMKCYKLVFSFKHFIKNAGSIILIVLVFLYLGFFIYFSIKGTSPLKTAISKILFDEKNVDNKLSPFFDINSSGKNKIKKSQSTKAKSVKTKSVKAKSVKTKSEKPKSVKPKSEKAKSMKTKSAKARSTKGDNPPRRSLKNTLKINFGNKDRLIENKIFASNPMNLNNINMNTNNILIDNNEKDEQTKNEEDPKINNQITSSIKRKDSHKGIQINAGGVKSFYMNFNFGSNMRLKDSTEKKKKKRKANNSDDEKPKKVKFKEILESSSSMIEEPKPKKDEIMLDDYELNHLGYLEALELDKRSCCRIYCSLLKRDQNIIYTCITCNDYNLFFVKMAKFIFVLATLMAMNAFLFADKSFHKLFISGVHYYFNYQVLQITLSIIITYVAEVILCFLTLTDRNIYEIKSLSKDESNKEKIFQILNFVRHKLIAFFVGAFIILLFYWYFISAFCAVYPNTQKIYLIDCTISFLVFSIIPFFVYAISTIFRVISLKDNNKKRFRCLYLAGQAFPIA